MFTLQIAELGILRSRLLPLAEVANVADIKFSRISVSLVVSLSLSHTSSRLIAELQMSGPFFTVFSRYQILEYAGDDFRSSIPLDRFFLPMCIMRTDDLSLTIVIPEVQTFATLIFTHITGGFHSLTPMAMSPPQNEDVGSIDDGVFVGVDAAEFRNIATQLSVYSDQIWVTASASQVILSTREMVRQFVFSTEGDHCVVGGTALGDGVEFPVTLIPLEFFLSASTHDQLVWFHRSVDGYTIVKFFTGFWTKILACNPQDRWPQDRSFEVDSLDDIFPCNNGCEIVYV